MAVMIDGNISDLFFNHNVEDCVVKDGNGNFIEYNHDKMLEEAGMVIESLRRLGVGCLPSNEELVQDFYNRV